MDPNCTVFEISSDEEAEDCSHEWIANFFDEFVTEKDDPDDVVVVKEVINNTNKPKSKDVDEDDDDDECMVLDGDPDKIVSVVDDKNADSDELAIVGEKGQIACRDYPHPRHLCVQFPFSSTPHSWNCDQCHCYVCDSLAPCVHWGNGISNLDHCHATEKEEIWKSHRKNFKLKRCTSLPPSKVPDSALPLAPTHLNHVPSLSRANTMPNFQVSRPAALHASSSPTAYGVPNIINREKGEFVSVSAKQRCQQKMASQSILGAFNNNYNYVQRSRAHIIGNLSPRSPMFKRPGTAESSMLNNGSGNVIREHVSRVSRNLPAVATVTNRNHPAVATVTNRNHPAVATVTNRNHPAVATAVNRNHVTVSTATNRNPPTGSTTINKYHPTAATTINRNRASVTTTINRRQDSQSFINAESNMGIALTSPTSNQTVTQCQTMPPSSNLCGDQSHNGVDSCLSDLGDHQRNQQTGLEIPQFHYTASANVTSNNQSQYAEPIKEPCVSDFTSQGVVEYFDFEDWLLDNPPAGVPEARVPCAESVLPPQPAHIDAGMLYFDFETSWNGLHMHS